MFDPERIDPWPIHWGRFVASLFLLVKYLTEKACPVQSINGALKYDLRKLFANMVLNWIIVGSAFFTRPAVF